MKKYILLLILHISCFFFYSSGVVVDYLHDGDSALYEMIPTKQFINNIAITMDVPVEKNDFLSTLGLREKAWVSAQDISSACFYLKHTHQYEKIVVSLDVKNEKACLTFILSRAWLFAHLNISGVLFSKEKLRRRYILTPGEKFDESKHHKSLIRIRDHYRKRGYLAVKVHDIVTRRERTKEVFVKLIVEKAARYTICGITLNINQPGHGELESSLLHYVRKALLFRWYKGSRLKSIARYIKHILIMHGYPVAKVRVASKTAQKRKVYLAFSIDLDLKNKITICGNCYFSHEQLMEHITKDKRLLWHLSTPFLVHHIKEKYKAKGFLNVRVDVDQDESGWIINIFEGVRINVVEVEFVGVHAFKDDQLKPFFMPLILKDVVDDRMERDAFDAVLNFYAEHGFWDTEIERKTLVPLERERFKLIVQLDEGRQRLLKDIEFQLKDNDRYKKYINETLKLPAPFNVKILDEHKEFIEQDVRERGAIATIYPSLHEALDGVVLEWRESPPDKNLFFGKTIITGRPSIRQTRILHELAYKEGEPWCGKKIEDTFKHLQELGIFESIHVYPLTMTDPKGYRPVVVDVVADSPFELDARLGFLLGHHSWANTYKVGGSCLYKNVTGNADTFCFDADATRFYRDIEARYKYPRLAGLSLSLEGKLFSREFDRLCFLGCKDRLYTTSAYGGVLHLNYHQPPILFDICVGLESIKLFNLFTSCARAIDFDPCLINSRESFLFIEPQLTIERVDNTLNPQAGFISRIFSRVMVPLNKGAMHYMRLVTEQLFFIPIGKRVVGAFRARIGHIFTSSFKDLLPSERFYLGGPSSVRSYQVDAVPPLGCFKCNDTINYVPIGSRTMVNITGELRIPLTSRIGAVVFHDIGILKHEAKGHAYWANGTGFGLRYITPIGPIRFDIAWKGKLVPSDCSIFSWYLTIGHAF